MKDFSGQILAEKYRVDSVLQEGTLGSLYHGTHLLMEKPVTIKILPPALAVDPNISNRFSAEAKTLSRISHPNILNVTDSGTDKTGAAYIVFENAEGETLRDAIRREGKFSLEHANRVTRQIAAALSVAHNNGVIHQNLTSQNILLTKTATDADFVKIINFGTLSAGEENEALNEEISAYDAEFLSPEQCAQTSQSDARSDVYSLGIVLYEMLAGEVPFMAEKPSDVMLKHAQEPPLPLSAFRADLPPEVDSIVLTALAKNPDARFQSANELAAALNRTSLGIADNVNAGEPFIRHNFAEPVKEGEPDDAQNNIWKTAFIVLAGIAVLSASFIYLTQVKQTNPATQLQTDANGQPVQPVNPPIGTTEQSLSNMGAYSPEIMSNSNAVNGMPQIMPGGDGYDPWARGGIPPQGAPQGNYSVPTYVPPSGQYYDGNANPNSPFMQDGNTYILVPKNTNTNVNTQPGKKNPAANTNTQTAPPTNTKPAANTNPATTNPPENKPTPAPKETKPAPKPTASPKNNTMQKPSSSGKQIDT